MSDDEAGKLILYGLRPEEYEHPLDKKALEALQDTPGLDKLLRWINEHYTEIQYTITHTGSNVKVTPTMFPELYKALEDVCNAIHLRPMPDMYIQQSPIINAFTVGSEHPIVVLNTATVELLTLPELEYIIGHECGHIKSGHCLYHMMAWYLLPAFGYAVEKVTLGLGGIAMDALYMGLSYWNRMSEYTADRAGLLACQDVTAVITACMKMGGVPQNHYKDINPAGFLEQARRFQEFDENTWKLVLKTIAIADSTHPWTVYRAKELDKWVQEGAYQKLLALRGVRARYVDCSNPNCHNKLLDTVKFCNQCGTMVNGVK